MNLLVVQLLIIVYKYIISLYCVNISKVTNIIIVILHSSSTIFYKEAYTV